jgi:3-phosphoglycerate kinase
MLNKLSIRDLDLKNKRVFIRVDFNVPIKGGRITDDTRIRESLPTIQYAIEQGAIVILASHLGRPKGEKKPEFSLKPVADRLSELLGKPVTFLPDCIGDSVKDPIRAAKGGKVFLLENLRFHKEEEENDEDFARHLADLAQVYVNDAFGSSHRAHASTAGITQYMEQCAAGFLMEKELNYLGRLITNPEKPFTAILGGAKISEKMEVISNLLTLVDNLLIGGGMAYTFLKSQGKSIGKSICEDDKLGLARELLGKATKRKLTFLLPQDHLASKSLESAAETKVFNDDIPDGWIGVDIGEATIAAYAEVIKGSRTIFWNGPMGVFEVDAFSRGTQAVAHAVAEAQATSVVGGGDSIAALHKASVAGKITHVSTGGGASLEFLSGKKLPGVEALTNK